MEKLVNDIAGVTVEKRGCMTEVEQWGLNRIQELDEQFGSMEISEDEYLEASLACNMVVDMPLELTQGYTTEELESILAELY